MTDFEKMVTKLRKSSFIEGLHFEIWEWKNGKKEIDFRPLTSCYEWACFEYDSRGNLTGIS